MFSCSQKAAFILEIKNKLKNAGIYSCILMYTVMLCLSLENHTVRSLSLREEWHRPRHDAENGNGDDDRTGIPPVGR